MDSYLHYGCFFRKVVKFTSPTDLDEYLFSPTGKYIPDTLLDLLENHQITAVHMSSRSFKSRICMHNLLSIEQYRRLHQPPEKLTVKTIIYTRVMFDHTIHDRSVKNGRYTYFGDAMSDILMIHYTVYGKDLHSYEKFYDWDYAMKPYV